ncbi:hypothetical protein EV363DRAFT_1472619 [Boletus edulis]|nr:hypothetical protein EV363DRAFT_1472619 [Boletus edulis]
MCFTRAHSILKCTFRIGAGETRLLILAVLVHVRVAWQHRFGKSFDGDSDQACRSSHRFDIQVGWLSRQRLVE